MQHKGDFDYLKPKIEGSLYDSYNELDETRPDPYPGTSFAHDYASGGTIDHSKGESFDEELQRKKQQSIADYAKMIDLNPLITTNNHIYTGGGKNAESGTKFDEGKSRLDLIDSEWLEGVGNVLAFGAQKYAAHNWRGGISYSRLLGALLRHTAAINRGEDYDAESGKPHIDHVSCCAMFLSWMMKHRKDLDDRYKYESCPVMDNNSNLLNNCGAAGSWVPIPNGIDVRSLRGGQHRLDLGDK